MPMKPAAITGLPVHRPDRLKDMLRANEFIQQLIAVNGLEAIGIDRLVFYPGMLFGTADKWWGRPGRRHSHHEGIDLCFFKTDSGRYCRMDETTRIPMAEDGQVVHMMDDFLARTVVTQQTGAGGRAFLTLYAHIEPEKQLCVGDRLSRGEVFARIASINNPKILLLPHLHISMAWADQLPEYANWTWKRLNHCGSECFVDPLTRMHLPHQVLSFEFGMDLAGEFMPCRDLTVKTLV